MGTPEASRGHLPGGRRCSQLFQSQVPHVFADTVGRPPRGLCPLLWEPAACPACTGQSPRDPRAAVGTAHLTAGWGSGGRRSHRGLRQSCPPRAGDGAVALRAVPSAAGGAPSPGGGAQAARTWCSRACHPSEGHSGSPSGKHRGAGWACGDTRPCGRGSARYASCVSYTNLRKAQP